MAAAPPALVSSSSHALERCAYPHLSNHDIRTGLSLAWFRRSKPHRSYEAILLTRRHKFLLFGAKFLCVRLVKWAAIRPHW
jgi:hypothetical protein